MSKFFLIITLLFAHLLAQASDLYSTVRSSLTENIHDAFTVQLIDSKQVASYIYIDVRTNAKLGLLFSQFQDELLRKGFSSELATHGEEYLLVIKLPKPQVELTIERLFSQLKDTPLKRLDLIVLGNINQQRLLGTINRLFNASRITFVDESQTMLAYPITLPTVELGTDQSNWKLGLLTALLNCGDNALKPLLFSYGNGTMSCQPFTPKSSLTDKQVANLKDKLYSSIQLAVAQPESFLRYIGAFKDSERLQLSREFFTELNNISIDSILNYHYKVLLNESISADQIATAPVAKPLYQFPDAYKVKSTFKHTNSDIISLLLTIDNQYTCQQINCQSLNLLPYLDYHSAGLTHTFRLRFPASHETSVIDELNTVLFIPLSTSQHIAQEDVELFVTGNFLLEAFSETFELLANLPLVKPGLQASREPGRDYPTHFIHEAAANNSLQWKVQAIPGGLFWEETELLYFTIAALSDELKSQLVLSKSNTLVRWTFKSEAYIEPDASTISLTEVSEQAADSHSQLIDSYQRLNNRLRQLTRDEFVNFKQGLLTNLALVDPEDEAVLLLEQQFGLSQPISLLQQKVQALSYEQFIRFIDELLPSSTLIFSLREELSEQQQGELIQSRAQ